MLDVEPVIRSELDRFADERRPAPDWRDVVDRAGSTGAAVHRRVLLVAAVALLALIVVAVAVAASFGGFRAWLTGEPGKPAAASAQAAFEQRTRSWRGFPHATQLRQLVAADVAGSHYELDGFRGAGSLCLRLVVTGPASATRFACAPLADLRAAHAPALVLQSDDSVGNTGSKVSVGPMTLTRALAVVTFGVLADGVQHVTLTHREPTATKVFVAGDAFLAVEPEPSPFNVTTRIVASAGQLSATVPFVPAGTPLSMPAPVVLPKPTGPTGVQREVSGGAIRWFAHRQLRGSAVPSTVHRIVGVEKGVIFARMITPEPGQPERMVVSIRPAGHVYFHGRLRNNRQVCAELVGGRYEGGGCWPAGRLFSTAPFTWSTATQRGGQVDVVSGLVADGVAALKLFPAIGEPRSIPFHDSGYDTAVTLQDLPVRLVAYDASGRIVGNKTLDASLPTSRPHSFPSPAPGAKWTKVLSNRWGTVYTVPSTDGGVCIGFTMGGGTSVGCDQLAPPGHLALGVGADRRHSWIEGQVPAGVRRLRVYLHDGRVIVIGPIDRYVLYRLDHSSIVDRGYRLKEIEGLSEGGTVVAMQRYG